MPGIGNLWTSETITLYSGQTLSEVNTTKGNLTSTANPAIRVVGDNVTIKNLIIQPDYWSNNTAIRLENVSNCVIENVQIIDQQNYPNNKYSPGIDIQCNGGTVSGNQLKHIKMSKINGGIRFSGSGIFRNTSMSDVGITLANYPVGQKGIEICAGCTLDSPYIVANTWIDKNKDNIINAADNSCGIYINGTITNAILIKFTTERTDITTGGFGIIKGPNGSINSGNIYHFKQGSLNRHTDPADLGDPNPAHFGKVIILDNDNCPN
jgi:hypothetical protein